MDMDNVLVECANDLECGTNSARVTCDCEEESTEVLGHGKRVTYDYAEESIEVLRHHKWIKVKDISKVHDEKVINSFQFAEIPVFNKFPQDFQSYNLVGYAYTSENKVYLKIEINPDHKPEPLFAYVLFNTSFDSPKGVEEIEARDFLQHSYSRMLSSTRLTLSVNTATSSNTQDWIKVTKSKHGSDAPQEVVNAVEFAVQHINSTGCLKETLKPNLLAYKYTDNSKTELYFMIGIDPDHGKYEYVLFNKSMGSVERAEEYDFRQRQSTIRTTTFALKANRITADFDDL